MNYCCLVGYLIIAQATCQMAQAQPAAQLAASSSQELPATVASICGIHRTYDQLTDSWRADPWRDSVPETVPLGSTPIELIIQSTEFSEQPVPRATEDAPGQC
jgi:hypothetical protein